MAAGFWVSTDVSLTFICQRETDDAETFSITEYDAERDGFAHRIVNDPMAGLPLTVLRTEITANVMRLAIAEGLTPVTVFPYRDPAPPIGETRPLFRDMGLVVGWDYEGNPVETGSGEPVTRRCMM